MKYKPFLIAVAVVASTLPSLASAQSNCGAGSCTIQSGFFNDTQTCKANEDAYFQNNFSSKNIDATIIKVYCVCDLTLKQQSPTCNRTSDASLGGRYAWKFDVKLVQLPTGSVQNQQSSGGGVQNQQSNSGGVQNQQGGSSGPSVSLYNPLKGGDLMSLLQGILDLLIRIGTIVIVLMLVYIGFLFATTSVNPENKTKAREALLWTLIGALILLGAKAIALGIQATATALSGG